MGNLQIKVLAIQLANSILSPSALALLHARENAESVLLDLKLVDSKEEAQLIINAVLDGTADVVQAFDQIRGTDK